MESATLHEDVEVSEATLRTLAELRQSSSAGELGIEKEDFHRLLLGIGRRYCFGHPEKPATQAQEQVRFLRGLRLEDLLLAHACAQGSEIAWERFLLLYRETLYQAGYSIAGSESLGRELADSLYADLFGLREKEGERQSPLRHYHGRGPLAAWLRSVLAQRYVDHYRRHRRETPLDEHEEPVAASNMQTAAAGDSSANRAILRKAVEEALHALNPEERFLLTAYYLDGRTLRELAPLLMTHSSTVHRHIERLTTQLRKHVLKGLRRAGVDRRQAQEMLSIDVRDLDIPLKKILQMSSNQTFPLSEAAIEAEGGSSDA
jgi:RNA polymerase sigma-70 factor (ECF subfamily)